MKTQLALQLVLFAFLICIRSTFAMALPGIDFNPSVNIKELPAECQVFIEKTLPANNWTGGFVSVPENWNDQKSRRVLVFYYYNNTLPAKPKPILFLNGGPFTSYHMRMEALNKQIEAFDTSNAKHTFVMMDQRGTGCSTPNLPEPGVRGVRHYKYYGSQAIVMDAEIIRMTLFGNTPWKIFAQSYGGFLSSRYLQYFPQSITEMHVYAPAFHESMSEFFWRRIKKQNEVLQKFLDYYSKDRKQLKAAIEKIRGADGSKYCIDGGEAGTKICGAPLSDAIVANIGQGKGRSLQGTEIWDGIYNALMALSANDSVDVNSENHKTFLKSAIASSAFFKLPTISVVFSLWSQEFPFASGNLHDDCNQAYGVLNRSGYATQNLLIDECRIIKNTIPMSLVKELSENFQFIKGKDFITQKRLAKLIRSKKGLKYYLYTGSLDTLVQIDSLQPLIQSGAVIYKNYESYGHAGWLFDPLVWRRLMDLE